MPSMLCGALPVAWLSDGSPGLKVNRASSSTTPAAATTAPTSSIMRRCRKSRPPSGRIVVLRGMTDEAPIRAMASAAPPSQHRRETGDRLARGLVVVHQRHSDVPLGWIYAVGFAADVGT